MSIYDTEDSLTTLNTALNKSMILMDNPVQHENKIKASNKLIKINTKAQPPNPPGESTEVTRKSILKKPRSPEISDDVDNPNVSKINDDVTTETTHTIQNRLPRPHNLEDFLKEDSVMSNEADSTFSLEDLSDSEEMWVMDIPKTVNPRKLQGQTLLLGEKSKLKVGDERYLAVSRNNGSCLTWVFNTGSNKRPYRAVNITPAGSISVRRKLAGTSKHSLDGWTDSTSVPFPSNLKIRHPFFGPSHGE